jgi:hypothetical protein
LTGHVIKEGGKVCIKYGGIVSFPHPRKSQGGDVHEAYIGNTHRKEYNRSRI